MRTRRLLWVLAGVLALAGGLLRADTMPSWKLFAEIRSIEPRVDRIDPFARTPPTARVYAGSELLGYALLTDQIHPIPGYSGRPVRVLVLLDTEDRIAGARIVAHEEPILAVGVRESDIARFVSQFAGIPADARVEIGGSRRAYQHLDGLTGATITAMVINASIMRSVHDAAAAAPLEDRPAALADAVQAKPAAPPRPLWKENWEARHVHIIVLLMGLLVLTALLMFQDWFAQRPVLLHRARIGFLIYTAVFIGWIALGQLSVINVLTFVHSFMRDFRWETFLMDPMLFILWGFVAVTLLLWGRGVYCGWLCPYGALQELVQQLGQRFKAVQLEFPAVVHERLWTLKYIILLVLFGMSLQSIGNSVRAAEVEPFKTAFALQMQREWYFVAYAVGLVIFSAFNRKFFCKYLCPLGAALAIPAQFRLFDWLRRRKECGRPCQICAKECEVRAIRQTGEINAHECHYCMDCQVTYWADRKCPPLVEKRKRRARAPRARELVRGMEAELGRSGLPVEIGTTRAEGDDA